MDSWDPLLFTWNYHNTAHGLHPNTNKKLKIKQITRKDLLHSSENSAPCHMAAWTGGEFGENGYIYMYGWVPSLFIWNITTLLISSSVQSSVMPDSLWPHELQHTKLPCPSSTPRAYSNSCPSSQWWHPTISSSVTPSPIFIFCSIRVFSNESVLHIRWPKYWSISPSNEYSGLISFRTDWVDLLAVQGTLKCLLQHHSSKA